MRSEDLVGLAAEQQVEGRTEQAAHRLAMASSPKLVDQPPNGKPCVQSSLSPPGACITPSSDWKTPPRSYASCFSPA
jgi:hypothetical protein